ncbi:MAG: DUF2569 domain-containing protein [Phycisphaerae bacterium]|nr:DUF2569 domain-containing protein [Phycisphaerae bacterium]
MSWWWYVTLGAFVLLVALLVVLICTRRRREKQGGQPNLVGISGWLLLPMLGLIGTPLVLIGGIIQNVNAFFTTAMRGYPYLTGAAVVEIVLSLAILAFDIVLLVFFFQKRSFVPRLYIVFLVTVLAVNLLMLPIIAWVGQAEGLDLREAVRGYGEGFGRTLIACAIWIPYFCVSKRVKATFVR